MGVIAALSKAGFEAGDDVRVGEHEFELHVRCQGRRCGRRVGGPLSHEQREVRSGVP